MPAYTEEPITRPYSAEDVMTHEEFVMQDLRHGAQIVGLLLLLVVVIYVVRHSWRPALQLCARVLYAIGIDARKIAARWREFDPR